MRTQQKDPGLDLIIAALIISLGLITAAAIFVWGPSFSTPVPVRSAKAQFATRMKQIFGKETFNIDGVNRTLHDVAVDDVRFSRDGEKMTIVYRLLWQPEKTNPSAIENPAYCNLTAINVGRFTTGSYAVDIGGVVKRIQITIE